MNDDKTSVLTNQREVQTPRNALGSDSAMTSEALVHASVPHIETALLSLLGTLTLTVKDQVNSHT